MKRFNLTLCMLLLLARCVAADDLAPFRERVEKQVATLPVTAHFDQAYAGTTNPKQMLDLYLPKERSGDKPLPVVVFIHGGGWRSSDRIKSADAPLRFVRTGHYAGISVSYRLSGEAQWPAQIHDCKAAIRWVRGQADKFNLDADRIGVWGTSAGGHLVSLLGTSGDVQELEGALGEFTPFSSRVTCVVNQCGPQDFQLPLMFRDGQPVNEDPAVAGLLGGRWDAAASASPVTYVTADDPPFLTLHGTRDERVDFKHAERIHAALTGVKVTSLLVPVTDGVHDLSKFPIYDRIGTFFDHYLRDLDVQVPEGPVTR